MGAGDLVGGHAQLKWPATVPVIGEFWFNKISFSFHIGWQFQVIGFVGICVGIRILSSFEFAIISNRSNGRLIKNIVFTFNRLAVNG